MADNVTLNAGSGGDTISADDIAGVKVQRVKVQHGADGSATDVSTASPMPVTLANTGANSTAIVVDGSGVTQPVSGTVSANIRDGSGNSITSAVRGSERAVSVQIVDGSGNQVTSFGGTGGTASNFGSSVPSAGTAVGFSDGTNMQAARAFDADSGAGTQYVLGAILRKAASGGSVEAGTSSDPLRVDPTGTTAQPVTDNSGSLTVDAPVGTPVFVRLSDGASAISTLPVSLASVPSHAVTNAGTFAVQAASAGDVAQDAADSGNPVKVGARAVSTLATATMVSAADRTNAVADLDQAVIVRSQCPLADVITERVTNTDGASTAFTNFSAVSNTRNVITSIVAINTSASFAYVDFRDGTGGSVLYSLPLPATSGCVLPAGATPYFRTSANTALAFDASAATTTIILSVSGFQSKV